MTSQAIKNNPITCAIYCRYSSTKQSDGYSIEAQKEACLDYANKQGWKVHKVYVDKAISGTSDERDAFQEIIGDTLSGDETPYSVILVHKLDRFARNRYDSIRYKHILKKRGVRVASVTQPILGSGDPTEVLLESLLEGMDEFYSLNLAREAIKGMVQNAKQGFWNGGNAPYGYRLKKMAHNGRQRSKLEVNPVEAHIVKQIFQWYLAGNIGIKGIAVKLNDRGVKPRSGRYWNKTIIERILSSEKYVGDIAFGKRQNKKKSSYLPGFVLQVAKDSHPSIVSRQVFEKVQNVLKKRTPEASAPNSHNDSFLLSSLIVCKKCGGRYVGASAKSGKHFYYRCGTENRNGRKACNSGLIRRDLIESAVVNAIREKFVSRKDIEAVVGDLFEFLKELKRKTDRELSTVRADIVDKEKRLGKLYEAIEKSTSGLTADDLGPRVRQLKDDLTALRAQEGQLVIRKKQHEGMSDDVKARAIMQFVKSLGEIFQDEAFLRNKQMIQEIISKIEYGDGHVDIYWHVPDPSTIPPARPAKGAVRTKDLLVSRACPSTNAIDPVRIKNNMVGRSCPTTNSFPDYIFFLTQKVFVVNTQLKSILKPTCPPTPVS